MRELRTFDYYCGTTYRWTKMETRDWSDKHFKVVCPECGKEHDVCRTPEVK
jgi:hypothetical protein